MPTRATRPPPPPKNANEAGHRRADGRRRFKKLTLLRRSYQMDRWAELTAAIFGPRAAVAMRRALAKHLAGVPLAFEGDRSFEATQALLDLLKGLPEGD